MMGVVDAAPVAGAELVTVPEHPILFSGRLVRVILSGSKVQTRRPLVSTNSLVNGHPPCLKRDPAIISAWPNLDFSKAWIDRGPSPAGNPGPYLKVPGADDSAHRVYSRIRPGDRLWVRETWSPSFDMATGADGVEYAADNAFVAIPRTLEALERWKAAYRLDRDAWRPSIRMPRWASRITLEVTAVKPERVQDISEEDARAEGVAMRECRAEDGVCIGIRCRRHASTISYAAAFSVLWDSIYSKRPGISWSDDTWVWAISFKRT